MVQLLDLLRHGFDQGRVSVTQRASGNPGNKVKIFASFGIPNTTTFSPF
jgi:hypothetical protein